MSMIVCKDCKNTVSDKAISCPKCGAVINKALTSVDQLCYGILMIVVILSVIGLVCWVSGV
jgi:RNA polymerase subunit RPABC4/transcription elongation factor Spt4